LARPVELQEPLPRDEFSTHKFCSHFQDFSQHMETVKIKPIQALYSK